MTADTLLQAAGREHALHLFKQMLRIRRLEEKCAQLYTEQKIRGFLHLYNGEEAVAVGVLESLAQTDAVVATYREHGHALIHGISASAIIAEMYGKQEGCSRGRGGSMHLFDARTRFYGGNAIVGGGLPLAVGLGLADKMQRRSGITACFFGDGAVAEGEFHESMNLAVLWQVPVLFVCENNFYAMGTALELSESDVDLTHKAESYKMPARQVDGMDVLAVEEATRAAIAFIRSGGGPFFLECRTYRFRAHSMFDAELYRSRSEVAEWKKKDPLLLLRSQLEEQQWLSGEQLQQLEASTAQEIEAAVAFAEAGSWEPVEDLLRFVYSEESS